MAEVCSKLSLNHTEIKNIYRTIEKLIWHASFVPNVFKYAPKYAHIALAGQLMRINNFSNTILSIIIIILWSLQIDASFHLTLHQWEKSALVGELSIAFIWKKDHRSTMAWISKMSKYFYNFAIIYNFCVNLLNWYALIECNECNCHIWSFIKAFKVKFSSVLKYDLNEIFKWLVFNFYLIDYLDIYSINVMDNHDSKYKFSSHSEKFYF